MKHEAKTYQLKINTLSPVHIGDDAGRDLSPYSDFYLSNDEQEFCYVDPKVLESALQESGKIEQYLEGINSKFDNNRSDFSLRSFLLGDLGLSEDQVIRSRIPNLGLRENLRQTIAATSKMLNQPYLPGSSLKGALRTAILYQWLVGTKHGHKALLQNFREISNLERIQQDKAEAKRRSRGPREEKQRMRELRRRERDILRRIFDESKLFGKITDSDARRIRISDSTPLPEESMQVVAAERIRLRPQNPQSRRASNIPQPREVIASGQSLKSDVGLVLPMRSEELSYFSIGPAKIKENLGVFAEECIDNELYLLRHADPPDRETRSKIERMQAFYERLFEKSQDGALLLRLGAGKTVYDNSLLLALIYGDEKQKEEETHLRQLRRTLFKVSTNTDIFPVTRTVMPDGTPMGWVEIEFER